MTERFFLPDHACAFQSLINRSPRSGLDGLGDPGERNNSSLIVDHERKNYVHMIGYDHRRVEFISTAMIVETGCKHYIPRHRRQGPANS